MPGRIRLSVVVVTFNSRDAVGASLPPLVAQLEPDDELIVVDNASTDGTAGRVRELAPAARVLAQERNLGFAEGCNAGAAHATGDLLLFLNPDAVVADGFAAAIRRPLAEGESWSAWMGLVTAERGAVVNSSGGVVHFTGIAWAGQAGEPAGAAPAAPREVAFASGACLAVPRAEWERLGGFSPAFFMYCEDVELSLRAWLWGGRVGLEPGARVDHDYEFAKGPLKWRLLERNRWATIVRTYPAPLLALLAPALLATEVALLPIAAASGWGAEKRRALGDTLRSLPRLLRERRAVQAQRVASAADFARLLTPDLESAFLGRAGRSAPLRLALRAYWSAVTALLRCGSRGPLSSPPARMSTRGSQRARSGPNTLELPASLFEALGRPRRLSLLPDSRGNLVVRRDGPADTVARIARRPRVHRARLRGADGGVARYGTSLALPESELGIANYERFYLLMPVGEAAERASREQSWQAIRDYHEHRPLDRQAATAHQVSEWLAGDVLVPLGARSFLELGCGAGRNLRSLAAAVPHAALHGLDINADAVDEARRHLPRASVDRGSLYELGGFADRSVDVVFTSGVLMHVPGDEVEPLLREMHRIADRAVVHFELHGPSQPFDFHRYPRDYEALYGELALPVDRYTVFTRGDFRSATPSFHHALLVSSVPPDR